MLIALDTETTGSDFYHGARPFLVTICDDTGSNTFWEWPVDPKTRKPSIPKADLKAITALLLDPSNTFVLHNSRFDCAAINSILLSLQGNASWVASGYWPWDRTEDTLVAAHVLGSALPHGLDSCAVQYLGYRKMGEYETRIELATKKARDYCRRFLPTWRIAKHGLPDMPSVKASANTKDKTGQNKDAAWKADMWLLKALLAHRDHPTDRLEMLSQYRREWLSQYDATGSIIPDTESSGDGLCADYANLDSAITHRLWPVMKAELLRRDLWGQYKERMKLLPIAYRMERNGLTISETRLTELVSTFAKGVSDNHEICVRIAREMGYPLTMPKGSSNNGSLTTFCFGEATISCSRCNKRIVVTREQAHRQYGKNGVCKHCKQQATAVKSEWPWLNLHAIKHTESGKASIDKEAMDQYLKVEEITDTQREFLTALQASKFQSKAVEALSGYNAFWHEHRIPCASDEGSFYTNWKLIHPNLNPTGTDTLRWSCRNPNLQNISKKDEFNLRYPFGPAPDREHWSFDFKNIEKRIPAYESGEQTFIDLFEKADQPPYYGSDHILKFSVVYPHLWEKALQDHGPEHAAEWIKSPEGYKATNYQWIKNTNFALQYECGEAKADLTAHAKGVKKLLSGSFPKEAAMKRHWISYANRHGYIETMPRKSVNPNRGYPLMCTRSASGTVSPTIPLAYHISGTAMDLTAAAMVSCQYQLDVWNRECGIPDHYRMCLQVHDELFFDWPRAADPKTHPRRSNLARARIIQRLMEACGDDIICRRLDGTIVTLPTPVSVEYHPHSWSKGVAL